MREFRCRSLITLAAASLLAGGASTAQAARKAAPRRPAPKATAPAGVTTASIQRLEIQPKQAVLNGPRATQHLVVIAITKDGATSDVTDRAHFTLRDPKLAKVSGSELAPVRDGKTRVIAQVGALSSTPAELTVQNAKAPAEIEFVNDIMPILSKAGCNATACHGSPAGKGGFKLSLFGYEPELDHPAIAKDADGKRVDLKAPEKSLILEKAIGAVAHGGGMRFKKGSREYQTILGWIKDGAPGLGEFEARVRSMEVVPDQPWMPAPNARQHLVVMAHMSDDTVHDVTEKALFSSNDDAVADVDSDGLVTAKQPGETAVMVRYLGQVAVSRIAVLPPWKLPHYRVLPKNNYVDELVQAKLKKLRMVPSEACTDEEFVRRLSLDVRGIIPTSDEVRAFLADRSPAKRSQLIDRYLGSTEFVDLWTMKWNDILRNNPRQSRLGLGPYAKWIREQVEQNRPYDQFVRDLVTATGRNTDIELTMDNLPPQLKRQLANKPRAQALLAQINRQPPNPAVNYYVISRDPLDVTSATSQIFLGVRVECARCHNHPFEKWTQNDYYGLAAFFGGIRTVGGNKAPNVVNFNPRTAAIRHPKTNEVMAPKTLDGTELKPEPGDKRDELAAWLTSRDNPWFAKELVNRLWGYYFGRGIVDPIDDFRATNPASNPDLLDALAKDFIAHNFDVKYMHRTILNSRTYQQSSKANQYNRQDTSNFARFYPKRMMAEALYDSISQATGIFLGGPANGRRRQRPLAQAGGLGKYARSAREGLPDDPIKRVMQLPIAAGAQFAAGGRRGAGNVGQFLDTFGKPRREVVCECERSADGNMGQALALMNGDEVNAKISAPFGKVQQLIRSRQPDPQAIEELYLATLSRQPTPQELSGAAQLIRTSKSRGEGIEDLAWSLLNSREFLFVH